MRNYERQAEQKALEELEASPEMIKLREKEKKNLQEQQRIKDKIARLQKKETEKERKARTHRLIVLGAEVEALFGRKIADGTDEWECIKHYMPIVRREWENGNFAKVLEKKKREAEEAKARNAMSVQVEDDEE